MAAGGWCNTEYRVKPVYFNWKIKNFPLFTKEGESLESSVFAAGDEKKSLWCLMLYPNGTKNENDHLRLYLQLVSCTDRNVRARYSLYLYDDKMERREKSSFTREFTEGTFGYAKIVRREYLLSEKNGLLPNSVLNIGCEIDVIESLTVKSGVNEQTSSGVVNCDLSENLGHLLSSKKFCDVTLNVKGGKVHAHKAILAARSPVFSAMFGHEMQESANNEVDITDIEKEIMEEVLYYIYTGKVDNLEKFAPEMLAASDKYDLPRLKMICQNHLCSKLSVDTVMDLLSLAEKHNAERLKECAVSYFLSESKAVFTTEGWETFSSERPDLLKELLVAVAQKSNSQDPHFR